ncbi:hypothetical protein AWB64_01829 [Caballeronia sordidicola]|uniref:Uncharacterized protein n=1 Tax=Caballeronia sordidicola TaxID=196367 RepID=A0A158FVK8_CABSO|nr:hypothetical protein AWB64_01829 [Caballeronia sordidicola]
MLIRACGHSLKPAYGGRASSVPSHFIHHINSSSQSGDKKP